jgi:aubergine-like protein
MTSWGLQFANELVTCKARILPAKPLLTGASRINIREGDWSHDMQSESLNSCKQYHKIMLQKQIGSKGNKMCVSVVFKDWVVIHSNKVNSQIRHFVEKIRTVGAAQGFNVPVPH